MGCTLVGMKRELMKPTVGWQNYACIAIMAGLLFLSFVSETASDVRASNVLLGLAGIVFIRWLSYDFAYQNAKQQWRDNMEYEQFHSRATKSHPMKSQTTGVGSPQSL